MEDKTKNKILFSGNPIHDWIMLIFSMTTRASLLAAGRFLHRIFWASRYSGKELNIVENDFSELPFLYSYFFEYFKENSLKRFDSSIEEMEAFHRLDCLSSRYLCDRLQEIEKRFNSKIYILTPFDRIYPEELLILPNPPPFIFATGKIEDLANNKVVNLGGIIGSRTPSRYGIKIAEEIAKYLVSKGIGIVSGLARGVDITAQRAAIRSGGYTIGVLGSGFLKIYPREHYADCIEIVRDGLLVTEYLPDDSPKPENFPERNRIISALSKFLIIVEAKERSGVFSTVESANLLGIDVWAVPGRIDSELSSGTNRLIAEGALALIDLDMLDIYSEN